MATVCLVRVTQLSLWPHHQVVKHFIKTLLPAHSAPLHPKLHLQPHCSLYSQLRQRESLLSFSSMIRLSWAPLPCEQISCAVLTPLCSSLRDWHARLILQRLGGFVTQWSPSQSITVALCRTIFQRRGSLPRGRRPSTIMTARRPVRVSNLQIGTA